MVTAVTNNPPVIDLNSSVLPGLDVSVTYTEQAANTEAIFGEFVYQQIAPSAFVTDADGDRVISMRIAITSGFVAGDVLFANPMPTFGHSTMVSNYDAATGVLSISGSITDYDNFNNNSTYYSVARGVIFRSTSDNPGTSRTISFTVSDSFGTSNPALAFVAVTPVNDAPVFGGLDAVVAYSENGTPVQLDANATIFDAELAQGISGTLHKPGKYAGMTLTIAREGGANPDDRFSSINPAVVLIGSQAVGAILSSVESSPVSPANISRVDGTLTIQFNADASQAQVDAVLQSIAYSNASENPEAEVRLVYSLTDGNSGAQGTGGAGLATGSITVNITPINDAPRALVDSYTLIEDGSLVVDTAHGLLANDSDAENDPFDAVLVNGPVHGSLSLNADGSFSYIPLPNFYGSDTFTYYAFDGTSAGNTINVSLSVLPVNDAPVLTVPGAQSVAAGGTLVFNAANGNAITVTDDMTDSDSIRVVLSGYDGTLTISPTAFLYFYEDLGSSIVFDGSVQNINRAFEGMTLQPGAAGTTHFSIQVTDVGTGGADLLSDAEIIDIDIVSGAIVHQSGSKFADMLFGAANSRDVIAGNKGNDVIDGGNLDDQLLGNGGNDTLFGGTGNDILFGGTQNDELHGGDGLDRLSGDQGNDELYGDAGADTFVFGKKFGMDTIFDFEDGADSIEFAKKVFANYGVVSSHMTQVGTDVLIDDGAGNTVLIKNTLLAELSEADFLFV